MAHTSGISLELLSLGSKAQERPKGRLSATLCIAGVLTLAAACGGQAQPAPGATFRGPIETGAGAASGSIGFTVSEDGAAITDLEITLTEVACDGLTVGSSYDLYGGWLTPIADGRFNGAIPAVLGGGTRSMSSDYSVDPDAVGAFPVVADLDNVGRVEGEFSSAGEAAGTITIHVRVMGTEWACELGTFPWSAASS